MRSRSCAVPFRRVLQLTVSKLARARPANQALAFSDPLWRQRSDCMCFPRTVASDRMRGFRSQHPGATCGRIRQRACAAVRCRLGANSKILRISSFIVGSELERKLEARKLAIFEFCRQMNSKNPQTCGDERYKFYGKLENLQF